MLRLRNSIVCLCLVFSALVPADLRAQTPSTCQQYLIDARQHWSEQIQGKFAEKVVQIEDFYLDLFTTLEGEISDPQDLMRDKLSGACSEFRNHIIRIQQRLEEHRGSLRRCDDADDCLNSESWRNDKVVELMQVLEMVRNSETVMCLLSDYHTCRSNK